MIIISTFKFKKTKKLKAKKACKPKKASKTSTKKAKSPKKKRKFYIFQLRSYWAGFGAALAKKKTNSSDPDKSTFAKQHLISGEDLSAASFAAGYEKGKKVEYYRDVDKYLEPKSGKSYWEKEDDRKYKYPFHKEL